MLRADDLAGAAVQAVLRLAVVLAHPFIVLAALLCTGAGLVVQIEVGRDVDIHRAFFHAVPAGRAGDLDRLFNDLADFRNDLLLFFRQRFEILHVGSVVIQLRVIAHAGEDHHDIV